jgi:hypothetical protein
LRDSRFQNFPGGESPRTPLDGIAPSAFASSPKNEGLPTPLDENERIVSDDDDNRSDVVIRITKMNLKTTMMIVKIDYRMQMVKMVMKKSSTTMKENPTTIESN